MVVNNKNKATKRFIAVLMELEQYVDWIVPADDTEKMNFRRVTGRGYLCQGLSTRSRFSFSSNYTLSVLLQLSRGFVKSASNFYLRLLYG